MKLSELIKTNPEFTRSINLTNDIGNSEIVNKYVWSKSNGRTLDHIMYELSDKTKNSAFTLTGPFGTGKSVFVLQLLNLLGASGSKIQLATIAKLKKAGVSSQKLIDGLQQAKNISFTILLTGKQESLQEAILNGVLSALKENNVKAKKTMAYIKNASSSKTISFKEVFLLLDQELPDNFNRINLIIDEFGKFLEYAALHPSKSDLIHLQEIAEIRKTDMRCNMMTLTILHQAFEGYAKYLSANSQNEWAKIQGRFQSLHITEDPEELVPLISEAFEPLKKNELVSNYVDKTAKKTEGMLFISNFWAKAELETVIKKAYPINSVALFVLPYLSKIAGQNTRSTFTFLNSQEPLALNPFLRNSEIEKGVCPQIDLAHLYDYFTHTDWQKTNLGGKWNEVEVALARLQNPSELQIKTLKTIGILNILQLPKKFPASLELISLSLMGTGASTKEIEKAMDDLIELKIIVYRKFAKEYRIWEGSDFNIEVAIEKRVSSLPSGVELVKKLNELCEQPTLIAKRHYEDKGTLRRFNVKFLEIDFIYSTDELDVLGKTLMAEGSEGGVGLIVTSNLEEYETASETLGATKIPSNLILVLARPDLILFDLLKECMALGDIMGNESELLSDVVAQKEVSSRLFDAQDRLNNKVNDVFWRFDGSNSVYWDGQLKDIASKRDFNALLSEAFGNYFNKAPTNHNELMNRPKVSGSVSAARKSLIRTVLNSKGKDILDMGSTPGTQTIYKLLYARTGMFEKVGGLYAFKKPTSKDWLKVWDEVTKYFDARIGQDVGFQDLLTYFEGKPFGIRSPVMMMFMLGYLETPNTGVALYDDGTYVPQKDEVLYEILSKRPKHFTLRKFGKAENEKNVLFALYKVMTNETLPDSEELLFDVLKVLYKPIRLLPSYVNQTRQTEEVTVKVRNAFLKANKPEELIFRILPEILGFNEKDLLAKDNEEISEEYASKIKEQLDILTGIMDTVIRKCMTDIRNVFAVSAKNIVGIRAELSKRVNQIENIASDPKVKNLILKVNNKAIKDDKWAENVLTAVTVKPINSWNDFDMQDFANKCQEIYRTFKNYELLASGLVGVSDEDKDVGVRYSLTTQDGTDINEVLYEDLNGKEIQSLAKKVESILAGVSVKETRSVLLHLLGKSHQTEKSKK